MNGLIAEGQTALTAIDNDKTDDIINGAFDSIDTRLERMAAKTLDDLKETRVSLTQMSIKNIETLEGDEAALRRCARRLEKADTDANVYTSIVVTKEKVSEIQNRLDRMAASPVGIQFAPERNIMKVLDTTKTFGEVQRTIPDAPCSAIRQKSR